MRINTDLGNILAETDESLYRVRFRFSTSNHNFVHERVDSIVGHLAYFEPDDVILSVSKIR